MIALLAALAFQCPDGTPPPCASRSARAGAAPSANSVAVLYFDAESRDSSDIVLAEGLTEDIINRLSGIERVTVRSKYLVRRYRGTALEDPAAVGRTLNVTYLVTGNVRRVGGRLRVSADLIRATSGAQVWGRQLDAPGGDVIAIQEAVSREVATGIVGRLLPDEARALSTRPTENPAAYEAVLRGNVYLARRDSAGLARAIDEYERARQLDASWTDAVSRVAIGYAIAAANGVSLGQSLDTLVARAMRAATEAVRRAPNSSEAWTAMGVSRLAAHPVTLEGVREAQERAIALDPSNPEPHHLLGNTLAILGQDSLGFVHDRMALAIDPARPVTVLHFLQPAMRDGRYEEAQRWLDSALGFDPGFFVGRAVRGALLAIRGDTAAARAEVASWSSIPQLRDLARLAALALQPAGPDSVERRRALIAAIPRDLPVVSASYGAMLVMAATHDGAVVTAMFEQTRPRGAFVHYFMRSKIFDPVRGNPAFQRLFRETTP